MSLLICSSKQARYNNQETGMTAPFSFKNYLGNTTEIPKHSEVAVQSVKIDRKGRYVIQGNETIGYVMFGADYVQQVDAPNEDYYEQYASSLLPFILEEGTYHSDDYLKMVKRSIHKGCMWHPDLECSAVSYNLKAGTQSPESLDITIQQRLSTGVPSTDLVDIRTLMTLPYGVLCEDDAIKSVATIPLVGALSFDGTGWDNVNKRWAGRALPAPVNSFNVAVFPDACLSFQLGQMEVNLAEVADWAWRVGVVRDQKIGGVQNGTMPDGSVRWKPHQNFMGNNNLNAGLPNNFAPTYDPLADPRNVGRNETMFFDYEVGSVLLGGVHYLRVYASGRNIDDLDTERGDIVADNEVEYWLTAGQELTGGGAYNLTTDTKGLTDIKLLFDGQSVRVLGYFATPAVGPTITAGAFVIGVRYKILVPGVTDFTLIGALNSAIGTEFVATGVGVGDGTADVVNAAAWADIVLDRQDTAYNLPPLTTSKYRLYPKVMVGNGDVTKRLNFPAMAVGIGSMGRSVVDSEYDFNDRLYGSSWYANSIKDNYLAGDNKAPGESANESDNRPGNCIGSSHLLAPPRRTADTNKYIDFKVGLIMEGENIDLDDEDKYILPRWLSTSADSSEQLGFVDASHYLDETNGVAGTTWGRKWTSSGLPSGVAGGSIFISCPTLTQISQNFGHGTPSKIMYHVPMFSNSGESIGPLFFEATEKTYLRLGNTESIHLDHLEIDIKNADETLCDELEGDTIVVLHIRRERR